MKIGIFNDEEVERLRGLLNDPFSEQIALLNIRNQVSSDEEYVDVLIELNELNITESEWENIITNEYHSVVRKPVGLNRALSFHFNKATEKCHIKSTYYVSLAKFEASNFKDFKYKAVTAYKESLKLFRKVFIKNLNN